MNRGAAAAGDRIGEVTNLARKENAGLECRGTLRNELRCDLQRQAMRSCRDGRSQVHRSGDLHPDFRGDGQGHGWTPHQLQLANHPWAVIGNGLIHLGDGQGGFIAKLQASVITGIGCFAMKEFGERNLVWSCRQR